MNFVANEGVRAALTAYGYEIVPVNSIAGWLFLVFSVLLLHSIYFKWENNGDVLSGTRRCFRCICLSGVFVSLYWPLSGLGEAGCFLAAVY